MSRARSVTFLIGVFALAACGPGAETNRYSTLIVNGLIYDGSTRPPVETNIGITGDTITSLDADAGAEADRIIDASGMVVVPGFIDPHTHAEDDLFEVPGNANINFLTQGVTTVFIGNDGRSMPDQETNLELMRTQGIGTNVAFFSGHNTIREAAMGLENRPPTDEELEHMKSLVERDMQAGALGFSTGLFYTPGNFSETEEVIELARVAARYGGVYDSHMRDESSYNIGVLGSVRETIRIAEEADIHVHMAHLKALGRDVWGQSGDIIGLVAAARERGVSITADQYPWRASGTRLSSSLVPDWVRADSVDAMWSRLNNPDLEDRIRQEMEANLWRRGGKDSFLITGESEWRGMTLGEIAEQMELEPVAAAVEVVRGGNPSVASFNMNPDDISALAIQPWVMTGSDGSPGHPRKYASFPKAYRDFVSEGVLMTMSQFVHRSAGLAADVFGLCDRGKIEIGRKADIAVLDLQTFLPIADFENPTELSTGVEHLLVNGAMAITDGEPTGVLAGNVVDFANLDCR